MTEDEIVDALAKAFELPTASVGVIGATTIADSDSREIVFERWETEGDFAVLGDVDLQHVVAEAVDLAGCAARFDESMERSTDLHDALLACAAGRENWEEWARHFETAFVFDDFAPSAVHARGLLTAARLARDAGRADLIQGSEVFPFDFTKNPLALQFKPDILVTNERQISILDTENFGKLAYVEVGATMVTMAAHPVRTSAYCCILYHWVIPVAPADSSFGGRCRIPGCPFVE